MKYLFFTGFLIVSILACKSSETDKKQSTSSATDLVKNAYTSYAASPSKEAAAKYIATVTAEFGKNPQAPANKANFSEAIRVAHQEKLTGAHVSLLSTYIKKYPNAKDHNERVESLIDIMNSTGKMDAANSLKMAYIYKDPESALANQFKSEFPNMPATAEDYIQSKGKAIFEATKPSEISSKAAFEYVDGVEAFVMVNPKNSLAPTYLARAAEVAKATGTYRKAIAIYDWIIEQYPNDRQAPLSLFLKALVFEENLNNIDQARVIYETFLQEYPSHPFADDAKFSLDNLGKTDAEIQAYLEELQRKNASK